MQEWRVPGYRTLRELLPQGTAGRSVLALHEASGLPVTLRFHSAGVEAEALRGDARTLAGLSSPQIVPLYEHVEVALAGGVGVATVREYVEGASLRPLMARGVPPEAALVLLRGGLLALTRAHAHGVTHRGYKPENILVDARGTARVADFAMIPAPPGPLDAPPGLEPIGHREDDVRAAFAVFVECVVGAKGGADRLPRKLRGLAEPAVGGDGAVLLDAVEGAGAAAWGRDWVARAERELIRLVGRVR